MKINASFFKDEELKQFINSSSSPYHETDSEDIEIDRLLDFFSDFFSLFEKNEKGKTLREYIQQDWNLFSDDIDIEKVLSVILQQLDSPFSVSDNLSYLQEVIDCVSYWETLKENLKWNRRFLVEPEKLIELEWDTLFNVYSIINSSNKFYRARIHPRGEKDQLGTNNLGCPPKEQSVGGRANPQGIPYLYLCNEIKTTLYETRVSPFDIVSVGTFQLKEEKEIKIIDFTQRESLFYAFSNKNIKMIDFVKGDLLRQRISRDLSKPMRRFDSEIEYLPTQFICEFVRYIVGATGIKFNSSLHPKGVNIVLFEPEKVECTEEKVCQVNFIQMEYKII